MRARKAVNITHRSSATNSHIFFKARITVTVFAGTTSSASSVESLHQSPPGKISLTNLIHFLSFSLKSTFSLSAKEASFSLLTGYPLTEADFTGKNKWNLLLEAENWSWAFCWLKWRFIEEVLMGNFVCWTRNAERGRELQRGRAMDEFSVGAWKKKWALSMHDFLIFEGECACNFLAREHVENNSCCFSYPSGWVACGDTTRST